MSTKHRDLIVEPGKISLRYSEAEAADLLVQWLDAFGENRHGVNTKAYLWHIFSE